MERDNDSMSPQRSRTLSSVKSYFDLGPSQNFHKLFQQGPTPMTTVSHRSNRRLALALTFRTVAHPLMRVVHVVLPRHIVF